jgi:transcriptional regulator with XRE-family HTH domain
VIILKTRLSLKEKLRDLREEKDITLTDVSDATGIPKSTLQRLEHEKEDLNAPEVRVGYQDIAALAKFYDVSADYLFGLTDNRQHRNIELDKLYLSDEAIAELQSGNLNNKMLSELITHPDFAELLVTMEVFVDRTISTYMGTINGVYKNAVDEINKLHIPAGRDEHLAALQELSVDQDDYLRFRLSQRFDKIAREIYECHEKIAQSETAGESMRLLNDPLRAFEIVKKKTGSVEQATVALWAVQLGIDYASIPNDERSAVYKFLSRSKYAPKQMKRKPRR